MKISLYILLFFILASFVTGNLVTFYENPLANTEILFYNINSSERILIKTDDFGRFDLSSHKLSENTYQHDLIMFAIGFNLTVFEYKEILYYIDGNISHAGYFTAIDKIENLNIKISSGPGLSVNQGYGCTGTNLYFCSMSVVEPMSGSFSYETFFPNKNGTSIHYFKPPFEEELFEGVYHISMLASDYSSATLYIDKYKISAIEVTNPNPERSIGIMEIVESYCSFKDGSTNKTDIFEGNETKSVPAIDISGNERPCTTENVFIKLGDINVDTGDISVTIFSISLLSVGLLSVLITFFLCRRFMNRGL